MVARAVDGEFGKHWRFSWPSSLDLTRDITVVRCFSSSADVHFAEGDVVDVTLDATRSRVTFSRY